MVYLVSQRSITVIRCRSSLTVLCWRAVKPQSINRCSQAPLTMHWYLHWASLSRRRKCKLRHVNLCLVCSMRVIISASQTQGRPVRCPARISLGTYPFSTVYSRPVQSSWDTRVAVAYTPMTRRLFAAVFRATLHSSRAACLRVLMMSGYRMRYNRLQLHMTKTDVLWCVSSRWLRSRTTRWGWARNLFSLFGLFEIWVSSGPSWLRPVDEHSHRANCFLLFCCSVTNTQHQSISHSARPAFTHYVAISWLDYGSETLSGQSACQLDDFSLSCRDWSTDPRNLTTWRRCCTTFIGCECRNESRFDWRQLAYRCLNGYTSL